MPHSLRSRAGAVALAGLIAIVALTSAVHAALPLGPAYPLKAAAYFVVIAGIAVSRISPANHPFEQFGAANQVTTARAVFVAMIAATIGETLDGAIAELTVAAAVGVTVMDGIDGWLARRTGMASAFGARFDMELDAFLILVLSILGWQYGKAGPWIIMSGLLRYLFVGAGWVWPWMERPLHPSRRRQTVCVVQVVALIVAIEPLVVPPLSSIVAAAALAILVGSFVVDTSWLVSHRREQVA